MVPDDRLLVGIVNHLKSFTQDVTETLINETHWDAKHKLANT